AQLFLPSRTCAGSDVIAQGIGAAVGMVLWATVGQRMTGHARVIWARTEGAVPRLLVAYLALLAFVQTLPLDLTPSPADLYRKFRDTVRYVPFGEFRNATELEAWNRTVTLIQVFALYLPVGLLASRLGGGVAGIAHPTKLALLALGVAIGMESLQLVVQSRTPSATDVVVGTCGALCGWAVGRCRVSWWMAVPWILLLAVHAWQPWTARTTPVAFEWIPGLPLEQGDPLFSLEEFLTKAVLFAPLGLIARHPALAAAVAAAVSMVFEIGQVFVSSRYPGVTDVLIAGFGAWVAASVAGRVIDREAR
ncbi:MAG TPA: VanZ family protein, partial [Gemmataceae bacterium]|nr:VanZ family protein [Gemmataceae bacterium]